MGVRKVLVRDYGRSGFGCPANRGAPKKDVNRYLDRNVFANPLNDTENEPYVEPDAEYKAYLVRIDASDYFDDDVEVEAEPEVNDGYGKGSCYFEDDEYWRPSYDATTETDRFPITEVTL